MAPPSQIAVATSSVLRLVKEEASYHKELEQQQERIAKLEANIKNNDDENAEYLVKQERQALEETRKVLVPLKSRIQDALARLEQQLEEVKENSGPDSVEEITKAKNAVAQAKTSIREIS